MFRTRIKICGITRSQDALTAAEFGADALGFVFYEKSPRFVTIAAADKICRGIPPFVSKVALFVDPDKQFVQQVIDNVEIDVLQFHGDESPSFCSQFTLPYIKAVRARSTHSICRAMEAHVDASGILVDSYVPGVPGGTGDVFDWSMLPAELHQKVILAGGLSATNVTEAIKAVKPYAVDVSGGVEQSKGIKDREKIHQFIKGVASADQIY